MTYSPKDICNLGLGRIAASRVTSLSPPTSALERHCADGYALWKRTELTRRQWVFSITTVQLTSEGPEATGLILGYNGGQAYRFPLPADCVRPLRPVVSSPYQWEQQGRYLLTRNSELVLKYIRDVPEAELEDEFVDVLAWRVAMECVEFATQSNTKKADVREDYRTAVNDAAKVNAFVLGDTLSNSDDMAFDWVTSRWG
jgi:hypothetical protein